MHLIFLCSLISAASAGGGWKDDAPDPEPTDAWKTKCKIQFENLGIYSNFSSPTAHVLHKMSIEDFKYFFNVDLPATNGIPTMNLNLTAPDSDAVLENLQSHPSDFKSSGIRAFDLVMTNIENPYWDMTGNALERLLHSLHMHDLFTKVKALIPNLDGITDDVCSCAEDTDENGIKDELFRKFKFLQHTFNTPNYTEMHGIPELKDSVSWSFWKKWKAFHVITEIDEEGGLKRAATYIYCVIRKFESCCQNKMVGSHTYTKVSTGKVPPNCNTNCIYERNDEPGSRYCFASGNLESICN